MLFIARQLSKHSFDGKVKFEQQKVIVESHECMRDTALTARLCDNAMLGWDSSPSWRPVVRASTGSDVMSTTNPGQYCSGCYCCRFTHRWFCCWMFRYFPVGLSQGALRPRPSLLPRI